MELLTYLEKEKDGKDLVALYNEMSAYDSEEKEIKKKIEKLKLEKEAFETKEHTMPSLLLKIGEMGINYPISANTYKKELIEEAILNKFIELIEVQQENLTTIKRWFRDQQKNPLFLTLMNSINKF
ncbi:hypothetical protein [Priestia megaterium]|uniref:Uncharacterized protein n=1 Tax=Priestia megaterium TaxID=1404 RepID=A0A6M6EBR0_PRIMG|nr:hypothetical protein [Priestia megaterium]QJX80945.1 hypothetical protein FDZ14_33175 [Priestia megaterium]